MEPTANTLTTAAARREFRQRVFPAGIPRLWCPPLTHYDREGAIDVRRVSAQLKHLSQFIRGVLVPGSTGDGWELTSRERRQILELVLELAPALDFQVLIGTLHPDPVATLALIRQDMEWLTSRFDSADPATALARARVCGFTICPPRGKELSQTEIGRALTAVLDLGLPTAIYQLPQVTQNEISPELAVDLAGRYSNFIFFKDTSGTDAVVRSGKSLDGVFTARGAEGSYANWLNIAGGPYEGFLLASANCFARELRQMADQLSAGESGPARDLSRRLSGAVEEVLKQAGGLRDGNPFANGMKAIDHYFAYGPGALKAPPPRLHAGSFLPADFLRATAEILRRQELMPGQGYLE